MRLRAVLLLGWLGLAIPTVAGAAEFVEIRREATLYRQPNRRAEVVVQVRPNAAEGPFLARLLRGDAENGYYHVHLASHEEGWIYKTLVRRSSARDVRRPSYRRALYPHWIDEDGDCQKARDEVLIRDDDDRIVTFQDRNQCKVAGGTWLDPYSGKTFRRARQLDVDHFVPLKNAHESGAWAWSRERRREYANYLRHEMHLLAVSASENRGKGDKGPDRYLPPRRQYHCEYVETWVRIKNDWGLEMTSGEAQAVRDVRSRCP
jgi:hypothetical protein